MMNCIVTSNIKKHVRNYYKMTPEQKKLNLLGLATRAGFLVSGDEMVEKAIKNNSVKLVVCASDASEATLNRYQLLCENYQARLITEFTREQISDAIGKSRSICAMGNNGMIKKFLSYEAE